MLFPYAGMKKLYLLCASQVSTQMVGSFGYSAPEFALSGVYTVKSDVYSFGVVMLELLTGRKPLDRYIYPTLLNWQFHVFLSCEVTNFLML